MSRAPLPLEPFPASPFLQLLCSSPRAQHTRAGGGVMTWDLHSDSTQHHARERMDVNELTSPPPQTRLLSMPTSLLSYTHWQAYTQTPYKTVRLKNGSEPRIWNIRVPSGFTLSPHTVHTAHSNRWVMNNWESNLEWSNITFIINRTCKHVLM